MTRRSRLHKRRTQRYSLQDWLQWSPDQRWEIIDGQAYPPAEEVPPFHRTLVERLALQILASTDLDPDDVIIGPRVLLFGENHQTCCNLVQPDLFVIRGARGDEQGFYHGTPELVIEVVAPATSKVDQNEKPELYAAHGVKQFWQIEPINRMVWINQLNDIGGYNFPRVIDANHRAEMDALPGLAIDWAAAFEM